MLEKFRAAKQQEIDRLKHQVQAGALPEIFPGQRLSFAEALLCSEPAAVIAEYKPASPSRGVISTDIQPREMARVYRAGGAGALSVLTEERYFQSSLSALWEMHGVGLPLLRKDFLFDRLQVRQTAATPASALLLIARMFVLEPAGLADLLQEAVQYGLEPVIEVFDEADLELARRAGATLIQVNNRDLSSLSVDLGRSRDLITRKRVSEIWISASGISRPEQVRELAALGFEACLIGTALMSSPNPLQMLQELI